MLDVVFLIEYEHTKSHIKNSTLSLCVLHTFFWFMVPHIFPATNRSNIIQSVLNKAMARKKEHNMHVDRILV